MKYGADWQPLELKLEARSRNIPVTLATSFSMTTAINEVTCKRCLELALREKDEQDKEALPRTPSELTETQDAERYRWLRKHGVYIVRDDSPHEGEAKWCHNELADAAIDARMKEES